ncbi:MAG: hypothetical protein ACRYGP_17610 [Janthinobacterium lividum]
MTIQLGDHVRYRAGMAPHAFKIRERDVGVVVAFDRHLGPTPWAMVQFEDYRSLILLQQLEVVGEPSSPNETSE